ncbi:MAG: hypothetical protein BAJALOKI2v1_120061 [Promethearchaeota archaeon]|nr:MAG: hypothetical protein BAJALOKI2v1_120061 [Candidatus Lokiarchaeota archaeon]
MIMYLLKNSQNRKTEGEFYEFPEFNYHANRRINRTLI